MGFSIDQILPSIQSLGMLGYWIIAAASMFEAYFITGVIVPGTLVVEAGGILVQRGLLDFFDLVWFVAIGSVLGGEASYWTGRLAKSKLHSQGRLMQSRAYGRARALFERHGGLALVLGRFLGPIAGLVPLVGALAGINRRSFVIWNLIGSVPYALIHVAFGYAIGGAIGLFSSTMERYAVLGAILVLVLVVIWWLLLRLFRLLPLVLTVAEAVVLSVAAWPPLARFLAAHPRITLFLSRRFDRSHFGGLPLTCLTVAFAYVLLIWVDVTLDFVFAAPFFAIDQNVAALAHLFWSPVLLRLSAHVTALGDSRVIVALFIAACVWLAAERRWSLMSGLAVAVVGNVVMVAALKLIFARPRPELGYFVETTGSFPSGHAAISIAFYGSVAYALFRSGRLSHVAAILLASLLGFVIGTSRLLLIEHYLSDVLNGWLVGLLWLMVGVTVAEWRLLQTRPGPLPPRPRAQRAGLLLCAALLIGGAGWRVVSYDKARLVHANLQADHVLAAPDALLSDPQFHPDAETLAGAQAAPINVILVAATDTAIQQTLTQAGWSVALAPTPGRLIDLAYATVRDQASADTMVLPLFWSGMPNDFAMISGASDGAPMLARIWRTQFVTGGRRVYVAAVTPDDRARDATATTDDVTAARDRFSAGLRGLNTVTLRAIAGGAVSVVEIP